jgi:hypothetical protein
MGEQYFCIRVAGTKIRPAGLSAPIFWLAKRISASIQAAWASSNFAKQNCDQPLSPHGLIADLNLLTVEKKGKKIR